MVVYFVQRESDGAIKIGYSARLHYRLYNLKSVAGEALKILSIFDGGQQAEKEMHALFDNFRLSGEWFEPRREILEYIETRSEDCLELANIPKGKQTPQYNRTCDVGKRRDDWLKDHPEKKFADIARAAIDSEMEKVEG